MERNGDQNILNVLKYNQDRLDEVTDHTEKAIADMDRAIAKSKQEEYDFVAVDSDIAKSLEVLREFGAKRPEVKKEVCISKEYETILVGDISVQNWDELVDEANEAGYTDIKIEDILTPEEIGDADARYQEIEDKFATKTKLKKKDIVFLITAIALQCVRQYVLTPLNERVSADQAAKKVPKGTGEDADGSKRYYASISQILSDKKVPYDTEFPTIAQHADTYKVFEKVKIRFETDKPSVAAAITKQYWHIKSDESTDGLPIPFLSVASPEIAQKLAELGVDTIALKQVAEQAGVALLVNYIISTIHGLMYDEKKDGTRQIYEVRTRKILLYSNLIASVSNLVVVGIGVAVGAASDNPEVTKKSLKHLDVGGLLVTIGRLFSDVRFITKVKDEFINMELDKDLQGEIDEIDAILILAETFG